MNTTAGRQIDVETAARELEAASPQDILSFALAAFGTKLAVATSFQAEGLVIIDMAMRLSREVPVLAVDTGRLPEETYAVAELYRRRGAKLRWFFPDAAAVESMLSQHGPVSFRETLAARQACCQVRKVEPMRRAVAGLEAWTTGRRRGQSDSRGGLAVLERDPQDAGVVKVNPLATWSREQVWQYLRDHHLPYNRLYDQGYTSIGCAPCTRATQAGEHPRAGRWWWESPEHKECGLHTHGSGI